MPLPAFFESRIWHGMALAAAPLALGFSLLAGRLFDPDHPTATPLLDKLNGLLPAGLRSGTMCSGVSPLPPGAGRGARLVP